MLEVKTLTKTKGKGNLLNSLNETYDEALKNADFELMVTKLGLERSRLIKYTSTLEECAIEYGNCRKCSNILECQNKVCGYAYLPKIVEGGLEFSYRACKYQKKLIKKNKFKENILYFKIPSSISEASFDKIYKSDKKRFETIIFLKEFMDKYKEDKHQKGLYLYGNFGSGKTYLIAAMFNEMAKDGIKSAIIFWPEFLRDLKASFNSEYKNEFNNKYNYVKKVPLLLIDDLGAESVSSWNRDEVLCPLLQYRMEEKLPTFITSNLNLEALEMHLSITSKGDEIIKAGRIVSRIKQLTEYKEMLSKNLRK